MVTASNSYEPVITKDVSKPIVSSKVMNRVRKAIEQTYSGLCNIVEKQDSKNEYGITTDKDVVVYKNVPCKLSFQSSNSYFSAKSAKRNGYNSALSQSIKLFLAPEIEVRAGSRVVVTQNGENYEYNQSGEPSKFETHQEIRLELVKKWA